MDERTSTGLTADNPLWEVTTSALEFDLFSGTARFFFSHVTSSRGDDGRMLPGRGDISAEG